MLQLLFFLTLWPTDPLGQCNIMYSRCAQDVRDLQNEMNGCMRQRLFTPLELPEKDHFTDLFECQNNSTHCDYTRMQWAHLVAQCFNSRG